MKHQNESLVSPSPTYLTFSSLPYAHVAWTGSLVPHTSHQACVSDVALSRCARVEHTSVGLPDVAQHLCVGGRGQPA